MLCDCAKIHDDNNLGCSRLFQALSLFLNQLLIDLNSFASTLATEIFLPENRLVDSIKYSFFLSNKHNSVEDVRRKHVLHISQRLNSITNWFVWPINWTPFAPHKVKNRWMFYSLSSSFNIYAIVLLIVCWISIHLNFYVWLYEKMTDDLRYCCMTSWNRLGSCVKNLGDFRTCQKKHPT